MVNSQISLLSLIIRGKFHDNHATQCNRPRSRTLYHLYGESYRSLILTRSSFARISIVSMRGEAFSFMMSLIVEAGIPVIRDTCLTDNFLFAIMISNNIFMEILFVDFYILFLIFYLQTKEKNVWGF